ncbi:hypothetical protein C8N47_1406 [Mangrovibacterium marinum]|uniref:Uncharacterized protein n=1 Tax=Mangrovibacterium marinum TaxID=1639118 RepID=A0A2T5BSC3_9BACT|nr:hypothetical protein C8N47_1406 [Mangrovibacterium marinum]
MLSHFNEQTSNQTAEAFNRGERKEDAEKGGPQIFTN